MAWMRAFGDGMRMRLVVVKARTHVGADRKRVPRARRIVVGSCTLLYTTEILVPSAVSLSSCCTCSVVRTSGVAAMEAFLILEIVHNKPQAEKDIFSLEPFIQDQLAFHVCGRILLLTVQRFV